MSQPTHQAEAARTPGVLSDPLPPDPFPIFRSWWDEAHARRAQPNPNSMTLATIDPDGRLGARIVLCKAFNMDGGFFVFYTSYTGRKAVALNAGSRAALVFHWDALDRQARIEGPVTVSPGDESDAYFASRPWQSRIGAWASDQSRPIESREAMERKIDAVMRRFGLDPRKPPADGSALTIPRPDHWGGYRVWAESIELWAGGPGRVHDRGLWTRTLSPMTGGFRAGAWVASRLQP